MDDQTEFFQRSVGPALAFSRVIPENPKGPTVVFLGGFRSDMQGTKALFLDQSCRQREQPFIRFDYRGHGRSDGIFEAGILSLWLQDALDIIDYLTTGPLVLAGSSMGGWIGLLAARARPQRIKGLVGIAAAPDFTADIYERMNSAQHEMMAREGFLKIPDHYSDQPYVITRALIEDGGRHFLLRQPLMLDIPVRLIQGMKDMDVEWQTAFRIKNVLNQAGNKDVAVLTVEDGDHRLCRPEDLALIDSQVQTLSV